MMVSVVLSVLMVLRWSAFLSIYVVDKFFLPVNMNIAARIFLLVLSCNSVIMLSIFVEDAFLEYHANSFDLDGDGIFGGAEQTPEQAAAMGLYTNDLGRNSALFTGWGYSALGVFVYLTLKSLVMLARGFWNPVREKGAH